MAFNTINNNISAYYAQKNLRDAGNKAQTSIARLSSGNRIINASDDVAALSIGTVLQTGVNTLKTALVNASQANSMLQIADGGLANITKILQRQKTLSVQATSGSLSSNERTFLNQEFQQLSSEIDRLVQSTKFNSVQLLDGSLGSTLDLASTDTIAAALVAGTNTTASTTSVEAFNSVDGSSVTGNGAGQLQLVGPDNTTVLADEAYQGVDPSLQGKVGTFALSNVEYAVSATLSVDIGGVKYSGTFADGATTAVLSNGNTRIEFGFNNALDLTDSGTAQSALVGANADFSDISVMRTSQVTGVNFQNTPLSDVTFNAAAGTPLVRLNNSNEVTIKNFQFIGSDSANNNFLSVEVNGSVFRSEAVNDDVNAGDVLTFTDGTGQVLQIDLTGLQANDPIADIRQNTQDRQVLLDALNKGFSNIGGGVDFAVGQVASDVITVSIKSVNTSSLYGNNDLTLATAASATAAGAQLDIAIASVTSIRADVGALQSRFNYATAGIETAIQNQDAARGVLLDADISEESTAFATQQVLLQAGISVLAQANTLPQNLLKLLS